MLLLSSLCRDYMLLKFAGNFVQPVQPLHTFAFDCYLSILFRRLQLLFLCFVLSCIVVCVLVWVWVSHCIALKWMFCDEIERENRRQVNKLHKFCFSIFGAKSSMDCGVIQAISGSHLKVTENITRHT